MWILAAFLVGAALSHLAPFPFLLEAFRPSGSLWHVDPPRGAPPTLYFTFDDGPNRRWTPPLLDALGHDGLAGVEGIMTLSQRSAAGCSAWQGTRGSMSAIGRQHKAGTRTHAPGHATDETLFDAAERAD